MIAFLKALIQFPRDNIDRFIFDYYFILIPLLLLMEALYDPAKSIKDNLLFFIVLNFPFFTHTYKRI